MDITRREHADTENDEVSILVESSDHELLVFHGSSEEEAEAKLEDFLTWAS